MQNPLNASASTAGSLISNSTFEVPIFQREYAWTRDEVEEFWSDLYSGLGDEPYFMGLIILTDEGGRLHVVDGQQRLLTLTIMAAILRQEALEIGRDALAEKIQSDFLRSINYETDETDPRVILSDMADNATLQKIINGAIDDDATLGNGDAEETVSTRMKSAFTVLRDHLRADLAVDPFKRLGVWTDFITNRLYFAVFLHPDSASAYKVFEAINTRGRELTTADLLKNYVLSQTGSKQKRARYEQWQRISQQFPSVGGNSFVQYIRHVVTVRAGHILPKDLYDYLAKRGQYVKRRPPSTPELMKMLENNLPLYLQMIDQTVGGPADGEMLKVFSALNSLSVISVRPILLALSDIPNAEDAARDVLRLVVRRIVVGNLGTGNVERRFSEAARKIHESHDWDAVKNDLSDLNPTRAEFVSQLARRSFNKSTLSFLRKSILARDISPEVAGSMHYIRPRSAPDWEGFDDEDVAYWVSTIGNTFIANVERRDRSATTWNGFKESMLPRAECTEFSSELNNYKVWDADAVQKMGEVLAEAAGNVWY